ncbi:unnamed protein product [Gadus morhua 'NCC']
MEPQWTFSLSPCCPETRAGQLALDRVLPALKIDQEVSLALSAEAALPPHYSHGTRFWELGGSEDNSVLMCGACSLAEWGVFSALWPDVGLPALRLHVGAAV